MNQQTGVAEGHIHGVEAACRRRCLTAVLRMAGLVATRQRLELADRLIGCGRHVTAEDLHREVTAAGHDIALATVYNTLRQFQARGLVRELASDGMKSVFDTNTSGHHHFYVPDEERMIDIPADQVALSRLPGIPQGYAVSRVEVIVRLKRVVE